MAVYVVPEPSVVEVPFPFVPCQYQVVPAGGVPLLVIVTDPHCGELLVGLEGAKTDPELTVTEVNPLEVLQHPFVFLALM